MVRLGNSDKFRANWVVAPSGLRIVRLTAGPLKMAGLQIDDLIIALDDQPLNSEIPLLKARDAIFAGKLKQAKLTVMHRGRSSSFLLQK